MPFYEYQCSACGRVSEVMQKFSDPPPKKCPNCGKSKLQKLVSAPVFRLKGSGWYETDFKGDKDNQRNLAGKEAEPEAKPASEAKVDAKADNKTETKDETKSEAPAKPVEAKAAPPAASRSAAKGKSARPVAKRPSARKAAPKKKLRR